MAKRKKSFADGFTVESLIGGSDSGPTGSASGSGSVKGSGKGYKGAPTLVSVNRGEKTLSEDAGSKNIYPPTYGGGNQQITTTAKRARGGKGGYMPTSTDRTNSPNPF